MKATETSPSAHVKKSQPEEFDLVILGGGTGSTIAAWTFAGEGKRVAVVDRKYIGGSCPNIACLPSKNIIHSAKVVDYFRRSKEFGIAHDGFTIEMSGVRDRKRKMVVGLNEMYMENYRKTGAEFLLGTGRFVAPRTVEAALLDGSTRQLRGTNVIVSTGTRASLEPIPGLAPSTTAHAHRDARIRSSPRTSARYRRWPRVRVPSRPPSSDVSPDVSGLRAADPG
jgi:pyruvate/2-oxoglutarate dehydrogenase complex dihydrolipoamide dehydrogenase (E3) component